MADNINVTQGTGTQMATDLIGEVHHPRVKIQIGEDGTANDVSSENPIPVTTQEGLATEAKQDLANNSLASIDEKLPALSSGRIPVDVGGATVNITGPVTVSNEVEIKNDSGNPIPVTESFESYEVLTNGSNLVLGANESFTGEAFDITKFSVLNVNVFSDVSSATNGVKVEFSPDGINWYHDHKTSYVSGTGIGFIFNCEFKFARVVYTNGAIAQSVFNLQTIAKKTYTESSLYTLDQTVKGSMFSKLVKSALTAKNPSGDYVSVDCTNGGNLKVSIEEVEGTLPVNTGLVQPLTNAQLRSGAIAVIADINGGTKIDIGVGGNTSLVSPANPLPVSVSGISTEAKQDITNERIGALNEAAPASDTASSGLNGRLQRIAQRISSLIGILPPARGKQIIDQSLSVTTAINEVLNVNLKANTVGFKSVLTSAIGTQAVQFSEVGIPCRSITVQNSTGVTIEVRSVFSDDFNNEFFYLPTGSFGTFKFSDVNQVTVKRLDNQNAQVRVTAYWEN
jgi:hypothetical protein